MSCRSSLCSESAASELDPQFRSLKETAISHRSLTQRPPSNHRYSPCSSLDSPLSIPPNVSFPLPPRRLRPGEIVGIKDFDAAALPPAEHLAASSTPASLYGVAIGGSHPTQINPTVKGRAEVQTDGLTSLDLKKMTLRARLADSPPAHSRPAAETVNLRARNPSRMLAPQHLALQSSSRHYVNLHSSTSNPQKLTKHASTLSQDPIAMTTLSLPRSRDLSRPPRNHSFFESATNSIPRLRSARLPGRSLSSHFDNSYELPHQTLSTIKRPLDEALSAAHPPTSRPQPLQTELAPVSQNRIKFAPLPNKHFSSKPNLSDSEYAKSKQLLKKKPAWIERWFSPIPTQASRPVSNQLRREISLPVPQTFVVTSTGAAMTSEMVPTLPIKRRSSVNDQQTPQDLPSKSQRPRSRSFSSGRPTLGMVANMVQRSPSRLLEETLVSGKTLLHGPQQICSPTRKQSLRNLVAETTSTSAKAVSSVELQSQCLNANKVNGESAGVTSFVTKAGNAQEAKSNVPADGLPVPTDQHDQVNPIEASEQHASASVRPTEEKVDIPKDRKKREIRFRNTLELIPDAVFKEPPQAVQPTPPDTSSERLKRTLQPSDASGLEPNKNKVPARNLNPFSHLRKPRSNESDRDDHHRSTPHTYGLVQRPHQSNTRSDFSPPNGPLKHNNLLSFRNRRDADNDENVNLCSRKLAPKINLTFVDLDHHIGSRFSVNTLFKEVQKSLPDVIPNEETQSHDSAGSEFDPITRTERQLTRRERPEPPSEDRSEEKDGSSSDTLDSPTTTTSTSNPVEMELSDPYMVHSGHDSVIEVVKTNGADVVFQMVVPVNPSGIKNTNSGERTGSGLGLKEGAYHSFKADQLENEEDDLTVISERLVALNNSFQAREARSTSSETNRGGNSSSRAEKRLTNKQQVNRVDKWLSTVPSPLPPAGIKAPCPSLDLNASHELLKPQTDEKLIEYPDSPVDRHHMPSKPLLKTS